MAKMNYFNLNFKCVFHSLNLVTSEAPVRGAESACDITKWAESVRSALQGAGSHTSFRLGNLDAKLIIFIWIQLHNCLLLENVFMLLFPVAVNG